MLYHRNYESMAIVQDLGNRLKGNCREERYMNTVYLVNSCLVSNKELRQTDRPAMGSSDLEEPFSLQVVHSEGREAPE